jgi:formate hydrogenlyase subunit 6/NADH:ubiquinone oxidoreductase subunit I
MARIVFRNLLSGPATRRYPYVVRPAFEGSRGRITIDYPSCIHCGACARRCPAGAIKVTREPGSWSIDAFSCVTCGLCIRVCPKKCLGMGNERPTAVLALDKAGRVESHVSPPKEIASASGASSPKGDADA